MGQKKQNDITDEELIRQVEAKGIPWRKHLRRLLSDIQTRKANSRPRERGWAKNIVKISDDFNEPLKDFADYME